MRVLDLFSGIGGMSLGLRMAGGFETVQFVEIEPYCQKVLAKNFPGVPIHGDIRTFSSPVKFDVICGGFPCQDISFAGLGAGIDGDRSGLWREIARLIGEIRPRYVILENVSALLGRGLDRVLGDLAEIGYDCEWHCIPASYVGAPHRRDRVWIVAHSMREGLQGRRISGGIGAQLHHVGDNCRWPPEPRVDRISNGLPNRIHRLRALGNSVVPQVVAELGKAILQAKRDAA